MTIEQFLGLSEGTLVYNKSKGKCAAIGSYRSHHKDIPIHELVARGMSNDKTKCYVGTSWVFCDLHPQTMNSENIFIGDRDEWHVINSFSDIDDQKFINKLLMREIVDLKMQLMLSRNIPGVATGINVNGAPVLTPSICIPAMSNLSPIYLK